jgi:hypothetical protein
MVFVLFWPAGIFYGFSRFHAFKIFVLPLFIICAGYFIMNAIILGSVVGHYGASTHLNFDITLLTSNFNKYISKFLFHLPFWDKRAKAYSVFGNDVVATASFLLYVIGCLVILLDIIKTRKERKTLVVMFVLFAMALAPVMNIYFNVITLIEGDRLGYFASAFFYPALALFAYSFMPRFKYLVIGSLLALNMSYLSFNTESWKQVSRISSSLIEKFKWDDAPAVYILNTADNYRGAYMFRTCCDTSSLSENLLVREKVDMRDRITEIVYFNMNTPVDSVHVTAISPLEIKLQFAQYGSWFWKYGIGAPTHRGSNYLFEPDEWGLSYRLTFDSALAPGTVLLYQCGDSWRELNF